jgi:Ca2+-binding EF-hand superfamily protein
MKKITSPVLVTLMAVTAMMVTPLWAQGAQNGKGKNMPTFAEFDLNGDGGITGNEFNTAHAERIAKHAQEGRKMKNLANACSFADIDTDGDGVVTPNEFSAHQVEHRKKMTEAMQDKQE